MPDAVKVISDSLDAGKLYAVRARALDPFGHVSSWSETFTFKTTTKITPPGAPQNVRATAGVRTIILQWDPVLENDFKAYEIHINPGVGEFNPLPSNMYGRIGQSNIEVISKYWNGSAWVNLVPGSSYSIKMRAVNQNGFVSGYTQYQSTTTGFATNGDIQAGTVTGDRIIAGTITTGNLSTLTFTSGKYVRSANFDGTFDANGNIVNNGTQGWALDWSGKIVASAGILRSTARIGTSRKVRIEENATTGKGIIGFDGPTMVGWFIPTIETSLFENYTIYNFTTNTYDTATTEFMNLVGPRKIINNMDPALWMGASTIEGATTSALRINTGSPGKIAEAELDYGQIILRAYDTNNTYYASVYANRLAPNETGDRAIVNVLQNFPGLPSDHLNRLVMYQDTSISARQLLMQSSTFNETGVNFWDNSINLTGEPLLRRAHTNLFNGKADHSVPGTNFLNIDYNGDLDETFWNMGTFTGVDQFAFAEYYGAYETNVLHELGMLTQGPALASASAQTLKVFNNQVLFHHRSAVAATYGSKTGCNISYVQNAAKTQYFVNSGFMSANTDGSGQIAVTYPTAFPTATTTVMVSAFSTNPQWFRVLNTATKTGFTVQCFDSTGTNLGGSVARQFCWMAIGS